MMMMMIQIEMIISMTVLKKNPQANLFLLMSQFSILILQTIQTYSSKQWLREKEEEEEEMMISKFKMRMTMRMRMRMRMRRVAEAEERDGGKAACFSYFWVLGCLLFHLIL